ncbi:MAG: carboxypeptidase regulatory-like domain-containing protein [Acidobacteria bacterium]|nr:carboxypeptidase regulatory-like domain-containing protein [Acidobacteriota bacterium]
MNRFLFGTVCATVLVLISCGGGSTPETKTEARREPAAPAAPDPNAGSIAGKIDFIGEKPKPKEISMDATPACARQHKGPIYSEEVIINPNGTVKNAFVYIKAGLAKKDYPAPPTPVKLDQKGCIYSPHVIGVMVGQPLEIYNSDDTNHNIHPMPKVNREWNESQPPKGEVKVKSFGQEEVPPILFKCNVHPWMRAWVGVLSHPYFAVSGEDGSFLLKDVPPGEYTLEAWHERFGTREIKVKLEAKQTLTAEFTFKN